MALAVSQPTAAHSYNAMAEAAVGHDEVKRPRRTTRLDNYLKRGEWEASCAWGGGSGQSSCVRRRGP